MKIPIISLLPLFLVACSHPSSQPIALHPENPHYFLWRGQPTILITSGEHYGALLNLDFDYTRYFDTLAADGLNLTRTFSGTYREVPGSFKITDNTLAPKPGRYLCPWARSDEPGYFDGGNKYDLTQWDPEYFRRVRDLMRRAREKGIVVEMNLFCPNYSREIWRASPMNMVNNVNGVGDCSRREAYSLDQKDLLDVQLAFTRKIVSELRDFDNLYYEVMNEPYAGKVPMDWQERIVDEIVATERDLGTRHLISLNIANGRKKIRDPHPEVSIFNFHYCFPPDTVAANYGLNKVIGENETGFRGPADVLYRTEAWDFLLAGGGLYNNLDYSFTAAHPDGTFRDYTSPGGGSPALRRQLGILKTFLYGFDFVHMAPAGDVVREASGKLTVTALAEKGQAYAIYAHVPLPPEPENLPELPRDNIQASLTLDLPAGEYTAEWVDTETGAVVGSDSFSHSGGGKQVGSPAFDNDIALRVTKPRR